MNELSAPSNSVENLNEVLQEIRPFQRAPPRTESGRERKKGKSTILTSDESIQEVRFEKEARAKQAAIAKRKAATAVKKEAATLKKLTAAAKKAAKNKAASASAPARVSKRQKTATRYAEESNSGEE